MLQREQESHTAQLLVVAGFPGPLQTALGKRLVRQGLGRRVAQQTDGARKGRSNMRSDTIPFGTSGQGSSRGFRVRFVVRVHSPSLPRLSPQPHSCAWRWRLLLLSKLPASAGANLFFVFVSFSKSMRIFGDLPIGLSVCPFFSSSPSLSKAPSLNFSSASPSFPSHSLARYRAHQRS